MSRDVGKLLDRIADLEHERDQTLQGMRASAAWQAERREELVRMVGRLMDVVDEMFDDYGGPQAEPASALTGARALLARVKARAGEVKCEGCNVAEGAPSPGCDCECHTDRSYHAPATPPVGEVDGLDRMLDEAEAAVEALPDTHGPGAGYCPTCGAGSGCGERKDHPL